MDGKLCPGIQPPFNPEIFQTPSFLKFWLESQTPPRAAAHYVGVKRLLSKYKL